jgi:hypothetical protein
MRSPCGTVAHVTRRFASELTRKAEHPSVSASLYHTSLPSAFSAGVRGVDHGGRVCGGDVGGFPLDEPELHSNDGTFIHAMTV